MVRKSDKLNERYCLGPKRFQKQAERRLDQPPVPLLEIAAVVAAAQALLHEQQAHQRAHLPQMRVQVSVVSQDLYFLSELHKCVVLYVAEGCFNYFVGVVVAHDFFFGLRAGKYGLHDAFYGGQGADLEGLVDLIDCAKVFCGAGFTLG